MKTHKIIVSGPESTGKSVLSKYLANHYKGLWIPEFARDYVENLGRPYNQQDVLDIAGKQIEQFKQSYPDQKWVFFDTGLMITKVWFEVVYNNCPPWIDQELQTMKPDLVLLCYPDLEWIPDSVRENGGEMRFSLFNFYKENLRKLNCPYHVIRGESNYRFNNAIEAIEKYINK